MLALVEGSVISIGKETDKLTSERRQEVSEILFKIGLKYKGYPRENPVKLFFFLSTTLFSGSCGGARHSLLPARYNRLTSIEDDRRYLISPITIEGMIK